MGEKKESWISKMRNRITGNANSEAEVESTTEIDSIDYVKEGASVYAPGRKMLEDAARKLMNEEVKDLLALEHMLNIMELYKKFT